MKVRKKERKNTSKNEEKDTAIRGRERNRNKKNAPIQEKEMGYK